MKTLQFVLLYLAALSFHSSGGKQAHKPNELIVKPHPSNPNAEMKMLESVAKETDEEEVILNRQKTIKASQDRLLDLQDSGTKLRYKRDKKGRRSKKKSKEVDTPELDDLFLKSRYEDNYDDDNTTEVASNETSTAEATQTTTDETTESDTTVEKDTTTEAEEDQGNNSAGTGKTNAAKKKAKMSYLISKIIAEEHAQEDEQDNGPYNLSPEYLQAYSAAAKNINKEIQGVLKQGNGQKETDYFKPISKTPSALDKDDVIDRTDNYRPKKPNYTGSYQYETERQRNSYRPRDRDNYRPRYRPRPREIYPPYRPYRYPRPSRPWENNDNFGMNL